MSGSKERGGRKGEPGRRQSDVAKFFLDAIVESLEDSVVSVDFDSRITSWNRCAERLYGYPAGEVIGKPLTALTLPEDIGRVMANIDAVKRGGEVQAYETERAHEGGRRLHLSITLSPVKDESGRVIGVSTVARDVTGRKKADDELRESLSRYGAALCVAGLGAFEWDLRTGAVTLDARAREIFGFGGGEEARAEDVFGRIHPEDFGRVSAEARASARDLSRLETEYRVVRPDGSVRTVVSTNEAAAGADGRAERMFGVFSDVTERRRAEEAARAGGELYEMVAKATNDAIWDWDLKTDRLAWNDGVRKLFGYEPEQVPGSVDWWYEHIHPEDRDRVVEGIHRVIDSGAQEWSDEYRFVKADGPFAEVSDRGFVIRDREGRPLRMLGGMTDITGRRREERDRQFLLELGEKIRLGALKPEELLGDVTRATGEHLGAGRCLFVEIDEAGDRGAVRHEFRREGLPPVPQEYRISDYSPETLEVIKTGRAVVNHDAESDDRTSEIFKTAYGPYGERSYVSVPLFTAGRWAGVFWVSDDRPRRWTSREVSLIEGVAERAWLAAEKLRNEAGLRESEERFRALVNQATAGITQTDRSGKFVFANDRYCQIVGYTREELLGMRMQDISDPEVVPANVELYQRAWRQGAPFVIEKQYIRKDGSRVWVSNNVAPVVGAGGKVESIVCVTMDVTERVLAQQNLRQSREMLGLAMSGSRMGAWSRNLLTDEVYWSPELEAIFGLPAGAFSGNLAAYYELVHPEDRERVRREVWEAIDGRRGYVIEFRYRHADGSERWMEGRGQAIYSAEGKPTQVFGIGIDITERKRAALNAEFIAEVADDLVRVSTPEEIVRAIGGRLNGFLGTSTCAFVEVSETAATATINYEWHREGVPSLVGVYRLPEFVTPEFMRAARSGETVVIRDATTDPRVADPRPWSELKIGAHVNVPLIQRGEWRFSLCVYHAEPYDWREDEVSLLRDLAPRVWTRLERALAEQEREGLLKREHAARVQAEEASRLKDEFLATVSHELRTPLTAILGWSHMLASGQFDQNYTARALETIYRNAKSQAQLVEDILDVSRIITGKVRISPRPISLAPVIQSAVESLRPSAEAKNIKLRVVLGSESRPVYADPDRLQQVFWNLLSNAVKFTPEGGQVTVGMESGESETVITVSDTGKGIDLEFLPFAFDRFRQADGSTTRRHGGLGLGLAIVRHITELHGGAAEVYSQGEGKGTTFTVRLPLSEAPAAEAGGNGSGPRRPDAGEAGRADYSGKVKGLRVLLVDDEKDTLELLSDALVRNGVEVEPRSNVRDALKLIKEWKPDIIVSDIAMPEEDGYSFIRKLRALPPEEGGGIPAVALTAYVGIKERTQALSSGFQMYVPKPVEASELLSALASLV